MLLNTLKHLKYHSKRNKFFYISHENSIFMTPEEAYNTLELHFPESIEWTTGSRLGGLELRMTVAPLKLGFSSPEKIATLGKECDCLSFLTALSPRLWFFGFFFFPCR